MKPLVVIVEDDAWLAEHYQRILAKHDYDTKHARSAEAAINLIDRHPPDVILLDMLLTGTNAMGLLHELQSHDDLSRIPVVLATNLADSLSLDSLKPYGVKRLLDKTNMRPDDIAASIRGALL